MQTNEVQSINREAWFESLQSKVRHAKIIPCDHLTSRKFLKSRLGRSECRPDFLVIIPKSEETSELCIAGEFQSDQHKSNDLLPKFSNYADSNFDGFIFVQSLAGLMDSAELLLREFENEDIIEIDSQFEAFFLFANDCGTHFWTPDLLLNELRNPIPLNEWLTILKNIRPTEISE